MHILRKLPFRDVPFKFEIAGELVTIRPFQIVVWVTLSVRDELEKDAPRFPAILDTGHNHNFSIQGSHLLRWAGMSREHFSPLGNILVNRQEIPLLAGRVWLHRNKPGTGDCLENPFKLDVSQGIAVYPESSAGGPRLPLLGIRGIVKSKLRLTIDGEFLQVSLQRKK
jgi:hypothetical protein